MKILEESMLLNNLKDMLDFAQYNEDEVSLVKRSSGKPIVVMTLKQYNDLQAKLYHLQQEVEKWKQQYLRRKKFL